MKKYALILLSLLLLLTFSVSDVRAYTITGYRPPSAESRYRIHGSFSNSQYNTVKAAANTWNNAGAKFKFVCESTPDYTPVDFTDNKFHVAFDAFYNYGYPGYANGVFVKKKNGQYGDIILNASCYWGNGSSSSYLDMQGILTDEFGHAAGLGDVYSSSDIRAGSPGNYYLTTMYAYSDYDMMNSYGMRSLETDDIVGIRALWP